MADTGETTTRPDWRIGLALLALLAFMLLRTVWISASPDSREVSALTDRTFQAISATKAAFELRSLRGTAHTPSSASGTRAPTISDRRQEDEAIADWRETALKTEQPGAWRRLGITLFLFGRPGGMDAFHRIHTPPASAKTIGDNRKKGEMARAIAAQEAKTGLTPAQETALWETIYGSWPLEKRQVASLRASLARLHLGWFENIAASQLYTKAGDIAAAQRALIHARHSAEEVNTVYSIQLCLILFGSGALLIAGARAHRRRRRAARWDLAPISPRPSPLSANTRLVAFVAYLLMMNVVGLPSFWLRPLTRAWSDETLFRVLLVAQLALYVPVVAVPLLLARRMASRHLSEGRPLSWRDMAESLGLRAPASGHSLRVAIVRYAMTLPFFLAAAALSAWLFRHISTPNPVQTDMLLAHSRTDRILLLLTAAVAAPIVEEIFFRGLLYSALRERWGVWGGAALSAAIFALVHPTLPAGFLPIWVLGASFALTYQRYGSLLPNILMHGLHNALLLWMAFAVLSR